MKLLTSIFVCITALAIYHFKNNLYTFKNILSDLKIQVNITKTQPTASITPKAAPMTNLTTDWKGLPVVPPNDPSLTKSPEMAVPRAIRQSILAVSQAEGVGARVRRSIGTPKLRNLTPFLMLDHFNVGNGAGFPDHPHRAFETITYLLSGGVDHEDFAGNKGSIGPGDLQFMTAGKGIVHAEMPRVNDDGSPNVGMQLWVDLPRSLKYCEPRYRDLRAEEIPIEESDGVTIKVISGQTAKGTLSKQDLSYTPVWFFDVTIKPGSKLVQPIPAGWNAFAYSLSGTVILGDGPQRRVVEQFYNTVFEQKGDTVVAEVDAGADSEARFILVAGMPLDQPIVQYGPFVVNSADEIYQAMHDFQNHANGFERAKDWESEIGKRMAQ